MNAMDKLSAVVIRADTRISEADRAFCQAHQNAYEAAKIALAELGTVCEDIISQQESLLPPKRSPYESRYIELDNMSVSGMNTRIENLHGLFIGKIVEYFNNTYHVSIEGQKIKDKLLPKEPKSGRYFGDSDKEAHRKYHQELLDLVVRYEDILDALFIQLGGRTFAERALDEIREDCHRAVWSSYNGKAEFEVKGDTIRFTSYACSCNSYVSSEYWELSDHMRNVLRGVAHFETGLFNNYPADISGAISRGHRNQPLLEFPNCQKVRQLKMFKNHRVDLKFAGREYARQFADEYLGKVY